MNVKFCGLTRARDLEAAARAGATHAGLVVQAPDSHRDLDLGEAAELARRAPQELETVLVTPTEDPDRLRRALEAVPADAVQATGDLAPEPLRSAADDAGLRAWKGLGLASDPETTLQRVDAFREADAVVLDALRGGYGGHGETVDWDHARDVSEQSPVPVVLAGGLGPDNVAEAIRRVAPWCVDVSSGIETDRRNDPDKMDAFADAVAREARP